MRRYIISRGWGKGDVRAARLMALTMRIVSLSQPPPHHHNNHGGGVMDESIAELSLRHFHSSQEKIIQTLTPLRDCYSRLNASAVLELWVLGILYCKRFLSKSWTYWTKKHNFKQLGKFGNNNIVEVWVVNCQNLNKILKIRSLKNRLLHVRNLFRTKKGRGTLKNNHSRP